MASAEDPMIGVWDLDPTTLNYQHGRPGRRAVYTVEANPVGLQFSLDGDDADGKRMQFTYGGALDGRDQPLPGIDAVLTLSRTSEGLVESVLKRGGVVVDRWTREVLPDGDTLRIIQWGRKPDGDPFQNVSLYRRRR